MPVWGVVVAAGAGARFGKPKQYEQLGGRSLVAHAVDLLRQACGGVVLVVPSSDVERFAGEADAVVAGGEIRSASVRNGLAAVPAEAGVVVVHDAARPLAPPALLHAVLAAVADGADGAVPGLAVPDTVKEVEGDRVVATLDRDRLVLVQTPQAFDAAALRRAHESLAAATDDAALVEAGGGRVVVVPGDPAAAKITTAQDLERLAGYLR